MHLKEELRHVAAKNKVLEGNVVAEGNSKDNGYNQNRSISNNYTYTDDWQISLNDFMSVVLKVPMIVKGFYVRTSIKEHITRIQNNRRKCIATNY